MARRTTTPAWLRWVLIGLVSVAAMLGLVWWLWPQAQDVQTGSAIAAVATAVGAVVGFAAALASWAAAEAAMRAARQSDETARHATEALGLAMEPRVRARHQVTEDGSEIWLWNPSRWAAANVEIIDKPAYGPERSYHRERLEPSSEVMGKPRSPAKIPAPTPPEPEQLTDLQWKGKVEWTNLLTVRYSDERSLLRWEVTYGETRSVDRPGDFSRGMTTVTIAKGPRRIR